MDRNEILKKAQAGNTGMDEREQQALGSGTGLRCGRAVDVRLMQAK